MPEHHAGHAVFGHTKSGQQHQLKFLMPRWSIWFAFRVLNCPSRLIDRSDAAPLKSGSSWSSCRNHRADDPHQLVLMDLEGQVDRDKTAKTPNGRIRHAEHRCTMSSAPA